MDGPYGGIHKGRPHLGGGGVSQNRNNEDEGGGGSPKKDVPLKYVKLTMKFVKILEKRTSSRGGGVTRLGPGQTRGEGGKKWVIFG